MGNIKDLTGQTFGKLIVIKYVYTKNHFLYWLCKCDCGNEKICCGHELKNGNIKSCGCLKKSRKQDIGNDKRLYNVWNTIRHRCYNPKRNSYHLYGGKGIGLCDEWQNDFSAFRDWALDNGYDETAKRGECTIDRIDNNKDYSPDNCRWTNMKIQCNNRSDNRLIEYNGCVHTLSEWANVLNVNKNSLNNRINNLKWSIEKSFTTPIKSRNNNKKKENKNYDY